MLAVLSHFVLFVIKYCLNVHKVGLSLLLDITLSSFSLNEITALTESLQIDKVIVKWKVSSDMKSFYHSTYLFFSTMSAILIHLRCNNERLYVMEVSYLFCIDCIFGSTPL